MCIFVQKVGHKTCDQQKKVGYITHRSRPLVFKPSCGVAFALELLSLAVCHLLALALAKLTQRLNINTVFPEFLFHRQCLFGCKVTKFPTKAFIARQKILSGVKV